MDLGVEICLDHNDARLRRNLSTFSTREAGGVHVQIIPSCGMEIKAENVAANDDGFMFNCDGQYAFAPSPLLKNSVFQNYSYELPLKVAEIVEDAISP